MLKQVSEGVVQGIFISAIGFAAATVWTNFQTSTKNLGLAKKQLDAQIIRNQQLIDFNNKQLKINQQNADVIDRQSQDIQRLNRMIAELQKENKDIAKKVSYQSQTDLSKELEAVTKSLSQHQILSTSIKQQQQSQLDQQLSTQQQQSLQQKLQQEW